MRGFPLGELAVESGVLTDHSAHIQRNNAVIEHRSGAGEQRMNSRLERVNE